MATVLRDWVLRCTIIMYVDMLLITLVNASCSPPRPGGEGTAGGGRVGARGRRGRRGGGDGDVGVGGGGGVAAARYQPPVLGLQMFARSNVRRTSQRTSGGGCFFSERDLWTPLDHGRGEYHRSLKAGKGT